MAYQKKTWLARLGQGLNKFIFNGGSKVTLDSSPDLVTQEGTPLSADNMNDLEQRIDDEFTNVNASITSLTTYSTDEVAWGKWIDGKTIYRKTLVGTSTAGTYDVSISGLNIDLVVNCEFTIKEGNVITIGNYNYRDDDKMNAYIDLSQQALRFRSGTGYAYGYFIVHLYYTKTS